jgi:hypoxanthine phosphoribosyltransferase
MGHILTSLSWDTVIGDVEQLAERVVKPDVIVSVSRGGNIPGTMLAYKLNVGEVVSFGLQSYHDSKSATSIKVVQEPSALLNFYNKTTKVLVVDDLSDKGATLQYADKYLRSKGIEAEFCTLYIKHGTKFMPNNYIRSFSDDEWIVFPWDR